MDKEPTKFVTFRDLHVIQNRVAESVFPDEIPPATPKKREPKSLQNPTSTLKKSANQSLSASQSLSDQQALESVPQSLSAQQ